MQKIDNMTASDMKMMMIESTMLIKTRREADLYTLTRPERTEKRFSTARTSRNL